MPGKTFVMKGHKKELPLQQQMTKCRVIVTRNESLPQVGQTTCYAWGFIQTIAAVPMNGYRALIGLLSDQYLMMPHR